MKGNLLILNDGVRSSEIIREQHAPESPYYPLYFYKGVNMCRNVSLGKVKKLQTMSFLTPGKGSACSGLSNHFTVTCGKIV